MFPGQREKQVSPKRGSDSLETFSPVASQGDELHHPVLSHMGRRERGLHLLPAHGGRHPSVPGAHCSPVADVKRLPPAATDPRSLGTPRHTHSSGGTQHRRLAWEPARRPGEFVSAKCRHRLSPATVGCFLPCREWVICQ